MSEQEALTRADDVLRQLDEWDVMNVTAVFDASMREGELDDRTRERDEALDLLRRLTKNEEIMWPADAGSDVRPLLDEADILLGRVLEEDK